MNLIVAEFLTLDGVMQAPGDPDEDAAEASSTAAGRCLPRPGRRQRHRRRDDRRGRIPAGRRTYELFAGFWPSQPDEDPIAATLNNLPKYVASTTLQEPLAWRNAPLLQGEVAEAVAKLKQQPGKDLQVIGSGELAQTLMRHDLVDEYRLMLHPLVLGSGRRLFRDGNPRATLRLVDTKTSSTGVLILTYRPAKQQ